MTIRFVREAEHEMLLSEQWLAQPPEQIWPFFTDAENLQRITPPWLDFQIATPTPIAMGEGTQIDYRLKVHGFPVRWRSIIRDWQPPYQFVDEQLKGPYRLWRHTHTFESHHSGTLAKDVVQFRPPGGAWVSRLFVRRDLRKIFTYRQKVLADFFGTQTRDS